MKFGKFNPQVFHYGMPPTPRSSGSPPEPSRAERALTAVRKALEAFTRLESARIEAEQLEGEAVAAIRALREDIFPRSS